MEDIATRGTYADDTAGRVMARKFVALREDCTAGEAVEQMRDEADRIRRIFTVYVTDASGRLTGTVEVGKLLLAQDDVLLKEIMNRDVIAVSTDTDQEEVLRLARKRDMRNGSRRQRRRPLDWADHPETAHSDSGGRSQRRYAADERCLR